MKKYEQDLVNGKFYEVKEQGFTDEEWEEFCNRWSSKKKKTYSKTDKFAFWFFGLAMLYLLAQLARGLF